MKGPGSQTGHGAACCLRGHQDRGHQDQGHMATTPGAQPSPGTQHLLEAPLMAQPYGSDIAPVRAVGNLQATARLEQRY